jgi:hypothetical protein
MMVCALWEAIETWLYPVPLEVGGSAIVSLSPI